MPQYQTHQQVVMQDFIQNSFSGGINTSKPPTLIGEDQAQDILNFEFTDEDHLTTRAGVFDWASGFTFPNRITSLHYYENDAGYKSVIATSANQLYSAVGVAPPFSNITGVLSLPNNTFWQWVNYAGIAIGVNGNAPIKVTGGTAALLGGTPPNAKYIALWNDRVWLVSASDPNVIYGSALGDPEDWTTTGAAGIVVLDISKNDGDRITGIHAFKDSLFVFKRNKIFVISALDGTIPQDSGNLFVQLYASNIGCVSAYSIQTVLDDVLFLSDSGVASLISAPLGELKTALVSRDVKEIRKINKTNNTVSSLVLEGANQYWLNVPRQFSPRNVDEIYVLDIRRIQEGLLRWLRFDGKIAGTVATNVLVNGERLVLVGGTDGKVYSYRPTLYNISGVWNLGTWDVTEWDSGGSVGNFDDNGLPYTKQIITKSFNFDLPFLRKLFHRFAMNISLPDGACQILFRYFFDDNKSLGDSFVFDFSPTITEGIWDISQWDNILWDRLVISDFSVVRQFKRIAIGRKFLSVTFDIKNVRREGFTLQQLLIQYANLNLRRVNDINKL